MITFDKNRGFLTINIALARGHKSIPYTAQFLVLLIQKESSDQFQVSGVSAARIKIDRTRSPAG